MNNTRSFLNVIVAASLALTAAACGTSATPNMKTASAVTPIHNITAEFCKTDKTQPWVVNGSEERQFTTESEAVDEALVKFTSKAPNITIRQLCPIPNDIAAPGVRSFNRDVTVATK